MQTPISSAASPCVNVCQLRTGTSLCDGCLRTVSEITEWRSASESRRRQILAEVAARRSLETEPPHAGPPTSPAFRPA